MVKASILGLIVLFTCVFSAPARAKNGKDFIKAANMVDDWFKKQDVPYFKEHRLFGSWTYKATENIEGVELTFTKEEFDILWLPIYTFDMKISGYYFDPKDFQTYSTSLPVGHEWSKEGLEVSLGFFIRWGGKILLLVVGFVILKNLDD